MCGIAGLVYADPTRPCEPEVVTAMRDVISYRGPDDSGNFIDGPVGLGFRRLSIIDLSGGHQPMAHAERRLTIIFNGEIYNYRDLREAMIGRGHTFRTHSDTEVILNLYAERGERCVELLNGMFAFAIWDADARSLFLARDRMGVKPLYYAQTADAFVFGSEIKSLFASGKVKPRLRAEALTEYLLFRQVAGHEPLFTDVKSLPPGCTMTVRDNRVRVTRYWSPRPPADRPPISYGEAVQTLRDLLEDSVRLRLISDVPVGTFCSGGIDSSLVTALAARLKGQGVNTFSVGFDEPDYDESAYAAMVSKQYGTIHHELRVGNAQFSELFPRMVWHNDEPLDFANSIQIFALSELAKRHVTVVLTGEGSDELFAGYPRYRIPDLTKSYQYVPAPIRKLISSVSGDHRLKKLERYAAYAPEDVLLYNSSYLRPELVAEACPLLPALQPSYRRDCLHGTASLGLDTVSRLSILDQETFLVSILNRQDKMSMAAGIESRVPFMDYRIVEFANRLPAEHKLKQGLGKAVVKDVARMVLPSEIVDRRKSGFGVPLPGWFRAKDGMGERLTALGDSASSEIFDRAVLRRLIDEHRAGTHDHSEMLWTALNVHTWRETFRC
jgi:asparagine synthase (glutamine-hydrolysing)